MLLLTIEREGRSEHVGRELSLVILHGKDISENPQVAAVLLTSFLDKFNQGDKVRILGQKTLKGQQELMEGLHITLRRWGRVCRCDTLDFVE